MKIMVMSDTESNAIWDFYTPDKLQGIDLILSCGDLNPYYLQFVETFSNVPLLYIHGNHDSRYAQDPPEGCFCVEDDVYIHNGIRILGLGGCMRYSNGKHQYTEAEMAKRIRRLRMKLWRTKGFDILMTHAPMEGVHDGDDICHKGFAAFRGLVQQYAPKYYVHGHVHMNYGYKTPRLSILDNTICINAYRTYTFDYEDSAIRTEAERFPIELT